MHSIAPRIRELLQTAGPMTCPELGEHFPPEARHSITGVLVRLRKQKEIHICRWTRTDTTSSREKPRAVYKFGPGVDVPNNIIPFSRREKSDRARERDRRRREAMRAQSIFTLAQNVIPAQKRRGEDRSPAQREAAKKAVAGMRRWLEARRAARQEGAQ